MTILKHVPVIILSAIAIFCIPMRTTAMPGMSASTATVVETINASQYSYIQIDVNGEKSWYAAPKTTLKVGDEISVPAGGLPMKDFHSDTLNRTFEMVYFVDSIALIDQQLQTQPLPPGHPPLDTLEAPKPTEIDLLDVERPEGGKTVAEIYQQQDALSGKPVLVRGKAVKVANGILGKNWIHLRDGSGEEGSNDLTITTSNTVEVGATITAHGTLNQDRDFGSGYKYAVLLEDAEIQSK